MADLPINLKFFKKLELYQDLVRQNKKAHKSKNEELKQIWHKEKKILMWATNKHHKLSRYLFENELWKMVYEKEYKKHRDTLIPKPQTEPLEKEIIIGRLKNDFKGGLANAMENLVVQGYATDKNANTTPNPICFTAEGLLIGEVINDCEGKWWLLNRIKYLLFIYITWATIFFGVLYAWILAISAIVKAVVQ